MYNYEIQFYLDERAKKTQHRYLLTYTLCGWSAKYKLLLAIFINDSRRFAYHRRNAKRCEEY